MGLINSAHRDILTHVLHRTAWRMITKEDRVAAY